MSDIFDDKRVLVACIAGIAIVLVISMTSIIFIWKNNLVPQNNVPNDINNIGIVSEGNTNIGKYSVVTVSREAQLKVYASDLIQKIQSSDIDGIYELLDPGYVEYFNVTKTSLEQNLKSKMILGKKLEMPKYKFANTGDKNVFVVEYSSLDSYINGKINIIEKSPNNYSIAFDDFIAYDKEPKNFVQDGLSLTVSNQVWFSTRCSFDVTFKNLNETSYIYNSNGSYENNYLILGSGTELRTLSTVVSGDSIELAKNAEIKYKLEFNISELSFATVKGILVKDIKSSVTGITQDYTFNF